MMPTTDSSVNRCRHIASNKTVDFHVFVSDGPIVGN